MRKVRSTVTQGLVQCRMSVTRVAEPGLDPEHEHHSALVLVLEEGRRLRMRT